MISDLILFVIKGNASWGGYRLGNENKVKMLDISNVPVSMPC